VTIREIVESDRGHWVRLRDALWPGSLSDHETETRTYFEERHKAPIIFVAEAEGGLSDSWNSTTASTHLVAVPHRCHSSRVGTWNLRCRGEASGGLSSKPPKPARVPRDTMKLPATPSSRTPRVSRLTSR